MARSELVVQKGWPWHDPTLCAVFARIYSQRDISLVVLSESAAWNDQEGALEDSLVIREAVVRWLYENCTLDVSTHHWRARLPAVPSPLPALAPLLLHPRLPDGALLAAAEIADELAEEDVRVATAFTMPATSVRKTIVISFDTYRNTFPFGWVIKNCSCRQGACTHVGRALSYQQRCAQAGHAAAVVADPGGSLSVGLANGVEIHAVQAYAMGGVGPKAVHVSMDEDNKELPLWCSSCKGARTWETVCEHQRLVFGDGRCQAEAGRCVEAGLCGL